MRLFGFYFSVEFLETRKYELNTIQHLIGCFREDANIKYKNFQDTKCKYRIDLSLKVITDDIDTNDSAESNVVSLVNLFQTKLFISFVQNSNSMACVCTDYLAIQRVALFLPRMVVHCFPVETIHGLIFHLVVLQVWLIAFFFPSP